MKRKDRLGVKLEEQNADDTALFKEDESASTGEDLPEFAVMAPAGRGRNIPSIEKGYMPTATPEEIYQAEQAMNKQNSLGELVTAKEEMEELARFREEQENPVNQSPAARLPEHALPPRSPQSVTPPQGAPPQIPGAATQPDLNPFANYGQPQAKPESGLPYKPKSMKHDCLSVHGWQKHEEWEEEQELKFFRSKKATWRGTRT